MQLLGMIVLIIATLTMPITHAQERSEKLCESIKTPDLLACATQRLEAADAQLNQVYRERMSSTGKRRAGLRGVQRTWIVFRDGYCDRIYEESRGGNEARIEMTSCLASLTEDRVRVLDCLARECDENILFRTLRALERSGYDRKAVLNALAFPPGDSTWTQYAEQHCEFIGAESEPARSECMAQLAIHRSY